GSPPGGPPAAAPLTPARREPLSPGYRNRTVARVPELDTHLSAARALAADVSPDLCLGLGSTAHRTTLTQPGGWERERRDWPIMTIAIPSLQSLFLRATARGNALGTATGF